MFPTGLPTGFPIGFPTGFSARFPTRFQTGPGGTGVSSEVSEWCLLTAQKWRSLRREGYASGFLG